MQDPELQRGVLDRLKRAVRRFFPGPAQAETDRGTLYVHVGTHKTGTSALQLFLSRNRRQLAQHGLSYPTLGCTPEGAHHYIANALKGPPFPLIKPELSADEYLEGLRQELLSQTRVLVSSEIFMRLLPGFKPALVEEMSALARLSEVAERVRPILYLRLQEDYLESFYRQTVLEQVKLSPEEFVEQRYLDYREICEQLEQVFGPGSPIVRVYDRSQFVEGNLFADFLSIFAIRPDSRFEASDLQANPTFDADAIEFRRQLNLLGLELQDATSFNAPLRRFSQQKLFGSEQGPHRNFMGKPLRQKIRAQSAPINQYIAERLPAHGALSGSPGELKRDSLVTTYTGLDAAAVCDIVEFL
ncbi:MAG: hypothetical protein ACPG1A_11030, partial [Halioglobus sp.]